MAKTIFVLMNERRILESFAANVNDRNWVCPAAEMVVGSP